MARIDNECFSCGKQCVNVEFCSEGASYDTNEDNGISLSRHLKVTVYANPDFWGFSGILIDGWASFSNGYYDFFDGHDESHYQTKTCGSITTGPFANEQRPDVLYRAVYDPDGSDVYYGSDGSLETTERGGAEVYLIDRPKGLIEAVSSDGASCDSTSPTQVFKKMPENFGFGNKINFNTKIYKNQTSAWRMTSLENCYEEAELGIPSGYLIDCSGAPKQNFSTRNNYLGLYEESRIKANPSQDCVQDGAVPGLYSGTLNPSSGIYRDTSTSPFLQVQFTNAEHLKEGMTISIDETSSSFNNTYTIFDVQSISGITLAKLVGTVGSEDVVFNGYGVWTAHNTVDPSTCCGGAAYGVDCMQSISNNYHSDFRRVINNPKNIRQSNRQFSDRNTYGLDIPSPNVDNNVARFSSNSPTLTSSGTVLLDSGGFPVFNQELSYYGDFYDVDTKDTLTRFDEKKSKMVGRNSTCYSKKATLEIFPDCYTQYSQYQECETLADKYQTNRLSRLAFVYRGCDFDDPCSFEESGRPLAGWSDGEFSPTGINDLKRGLAGQEIQMFVNLSDAWGGIYQRPACGCADPPPGEQPPDHVIIPSPVTFPCLPDFDKYPERYGCNDVRYQLKKYVDYQLGGQYSDLSPSEQCDPIPGYPTACDVRQPYPTYGFMMNLCGKQNRNRKNVIANAFNKLRQDQLKTYRNTTPTGVDIDEPMYWSFVADSPSPFGSGLWATGVSGDDAIGEIGGESYAHWGLSDSNGALVAPYFKTKGGYTTDCELATSPTYVDFDPSGTYVDGWPTNSVPFLIEIEQADSCVGCATVNMEDKPMVLEFESLDARYIFGFGDTDTSNGAAYGFNHCRYGGTVLNPSYSCSSGFPSTYCEFDDFYNVYGERYTGETCDNITGSTVMLYPVKIPNSDLVVGYRSSGTAEGSTIIPLESLSQYGSNLIDIDYFQTAGAGYKVYASFLLSCPGNESLLIDPEFPDAKYQGDIVSTLWNCGSTCSIHTPAKLGAGGDLSLRAKFWAVALPYVSIFDQLSDYEIEQIDLTDRIEYFGTNNIFGLCPGDYVNTYGCQIGSGFYGCAGDSGIPYGSCTGNTVCNTCPTGTDVGDVICNDCGSPIGYNGANGSRVSNAYTLNECYCDCSTPTLMGVYQLDSGYNPVLVSGSHADCGTVYWVGPSGQEPVLQYQGPPNPYMGLGLGLFIASDWFEYSHGVNSQASGVQYRIFDPATQGACDQLNITDCETGACEDSRALSSVCGQPIFSTGVPDVIVNRKMCYPEVMIVNKISCVEIDRGNEVTKGYQLTVSREHHSHDRTWYHQIVNDAMESVCVPYQYGAYRYDDGSISIDTEGNITSGTCTPIPYAIPTDMVTPAYLAPCSVNPSSGTYVSQDFQLNSGTVEPIWNYYNIFYESGFPTSAIPGISTDSTYVFSIASDSNGNPLCNTDAAGEAFDAGLGTGNFASPAYTWGTEATNVKHSCIQDIFECGADIFCNKIFFPRRRYREGTKIAPFGGDSLCLSTNEINRGNRYLGFEDADKSITLTNLSKETKLKFIDFCDSELLAEVPVRVSGEPYYNIGIDDVVITVDDYLPLMGVSHPGWRYTLDSKSCTIVGTGCAGFSAPTHSDATIAMSLGTPKTFLADNFDSMGYYLDRVTASGSDNCLLNPFKILVDVECSTNTIKRRGVDTDSPTLLTGTLQMPSAACGGLVAAPPCGCGSSVCADNLGSFAGSCHELKHLTYKYEVIEVGYRCPCDSNPCNEITIGNCETGVFQALKAVTTVNEYLYDGSLLEAATGIDGVYGSDTCSFQCGSGTCQEVRSWACDSVPANIFMDCNGDYYEVSSGGSYVNSWECDENVYISSLSNIKTNCCDLATVAGNGLCTAEKRSPKDISCSGNIVNDWEDAPANLESSSGWWTTDCGCESIPLKDTQCTSNSIVKFTITEAY